MGSFVSRALRNLVAERAQGICEYCLIHEDDTIFGCQIEHIISEKHRGKTIASNLAWACAECNRFKGSDIATVSPLTEKPCGLFNPRTDRWNDHFRISGHRILGISEIGHATVFLLRMNSPERIAERRALAAADRFPPAAALRLISRSSK